jgi:hypothetical protein
MLLSVQPCIDVRHPDVTGGEHEPELRRRLRAARLAEKHAKMKAALAEKVARDEEEARRKQEQVELKERHKAAVETWKNRNKVSQQKK